MIRDGHLTAFYLFEVADAVALDRVAGILGQAASPAKLSPKPATPAYVHISSRRSPSTARCSTCPGSEDCAFALPLRRRAIEHRAGRVPRADDHRHPGLRVDTARVGAIEVGCDGWVMRRQVDEQ